MNHLHTIQGQESESPAMVDESDSAITYVGYAQPGTVDTSEAKFAIKKISEAALIKTIEWANGSKVKDQAWDGRTGLTYSFLI